ncbi:DUF1521 domain-containing protein [Endozoicomonadaceae bacterium StTr2]
MSLGPINPSTGQPLPVSGGASVDGIKSQGEGGLGAYDPQTALMIVNIKRHNLIHSNLQSQIGAFQQMNAKMEKLGQLQASLSEASLQTPEFTETTWSSAKADNGDHKIDLGDGYKITVKNNDDAHWILEDADGNQTKIWGDPHVNYGNDSTKRDADFKGTITIMLDNGTKITVDTIPAAEAGRPDLGDQTFSEKLTITQANQVMVVDNIMSGAGTPTITGPSLQNARQIDDQTNDGVILREGDQGVGHFVDVTGQKVTGYFAQTTVINEHKDQHDDPVVNVEMLDFARSIGIDTTFTDPTTGQKVESDGFMTKDQIKIFKERVKGKQESFGNVTQLQTVKIQSWFNKLNQSIEMASNVESKSHNSKNTLIGNLR